MSHATLAKPLLPIFYMEREAKLFKRMIDEGIRKEIRFSTLISNCVSIFESANVDAANLKPPLWNLPFYIFINNFINFYFILKK